MLERQRGETPDALREPELGGRELARCVGVRAQEADHLVAAPERAA